MVVDAWVDVVAFRCVRCGHKWTARYDLLQSRGVQGVEREYFSVQGVGVPSPYTPKGASRCPECAWRAIGSPVTRRSVEGPAPRRRESERASAAADRRAGEGRR